MSAAAEVARPPLGLAGQVRFGLLATLSVLWVTLVAVVALICALLTLFRARRFCAEVVARRGAQLLLALWGIRVVLHTSKPWPQHQVVYLANHSSTLDLFVLLSLALPNTRFFLAGRYRYVVPLGLIAWLCGTFFTVPQQLGAQRVAIFRRADAVLRRSGASVFLSPEGTRVLGGRIGPFNKGAFHLATSLRAPIVPLFIRIPPTVDPGKGFNCRPGTVDVFVDETIDVSQWTLDDLERNRDQVRARYLQLSEEHRA